MDGVLLCPPRLRVAPGCLPTPRAELLTDAELRARLVASADALVHKADETLAPPTAPDLYLQTVKELIRANPKELGKLSEPTGFTDLAGAKAWLAAQLQAAAIQNAELWLKQYESDSRPSESPRLRRRSARHPQQ